MKLLSSQQAADALGISVATLYDWLARSDRGEFILRGQQLQISYFQCGSRGQGRIRIEDGEVERILEAMRVQPQPMSKRRPPMKQQVFPGIDVPLGRPD